jgi:hypothetical protein
VDARDEPASDGAIGLYSVKRRNIHACQSFQAQETTRSGKQPAIPRLPATVVPGLDNRADSASRVVHG